MNDSRINEIVSELSSAVRADQAKIYLEDREEVGLKIIANRAGYIRLAAESLAAASAPLAQGFEKIDADWNYLFTKNSPKISQVARADTVEIPPPSPLTGWELVRERTAIILGFAIILFLIASTFVGCYTILRHL